MLKYNLTRKIQVAVIATLLSQGAGAASTDEREAAVKENPLKEA